MGKRSRRGGRGEEGQDLLHGLEIPQSPPEVSATPEVSAQPLASAEPMGSVGAEASVEPETNSSPEAEPKLETQATPQPKLERASEDARLERLAQARDLVSGGRAADAAKLYREIVSDNPNNLKARNNLGALYDGLGQHERALEQFEAARALAPDNVEVLANIGAALLGLGRSEEAERELKRAMKLDPESVEVRANLGILFFRRGQYVQAENELRWVCEKDADHGPAHFYRGEALNRLGKVDKAIEVMEQAARLQPSNAKIYHTMGILFDKKHMPAEAAQMYRKVRELSR